MRILDILRQKIVITHAMENLFSQMIICFKQISPGDEMIEVFEGRLKELEKKVERMIHPFVKKYGGSIRNDLKKEGRDLFLSKAIMNKDKHELDAYPIILNSLLDSMQIARDQEKSYHKSNGVPDNHDMVVVINIGDDDD